MSVNKKPETPLEYSVWCAMSCCRSGQKCLNGEKQEMKTDADQMRYALYVLLHAVEDVAIAIGELARAKGGSDE
jgi:hypothetical protein